MGIYDRDYYRDKNGQSLFNDRVQATYILAGIYVCLFLLQLVARDAAGGMRHRAGNPVAEMLVLNVESVLDGEVWRVVTYSFVHDIRYIWPLVLNILFLVFFGRDLEQLYGWKEFLAFYVLAGILAGLGFLLVAALGHNGGVLLGPAGPVTAMLFLAALHNPRRTVLLFFVIPCPLWFIVAFYVLADTAGYLGGGVHAGAFVAHVVAASFAVVYYRYSLRITDWLPGMPSRSGRARARPKLRVFRGEPGDAEVAPAASSIPTSASMALGQSGEAVGSPSALSAMDEHLEAKLDEVLEKVKRHGQESLTEEERAVLFRASEIYRKRRKGGN